MSVFEEIKRIETLTDQKRLLSAKIAIETALKKFSDPISQALLSYQIGVLYWGEIGDGEKARFYFEQTIQLYDKYTQLQTSSSNLPPLKQNSYENMMVLSLSYDEYINWANKLEQVEPDNPILHVQVKQVNELSERGYSWGTIMIITMARPHINPEANSMGGRYASGASILQLVLKNRKDLRLSRDEWQQATVWYSGAVRAAISNYGNIMHKLTNDEFAYPDEFIFMTEVAIPLTEEYVNENPSDENGQEALSGLKYLRDAARKGASKKKQMSPVSAHDFSSPQVSQKTRCAECNAGLGLVNYIRTEQFSSGKVRGALKCNKCNRIYCLDCSDTSKPCYCGSYDWRERAYAPLEEDPPFLLDETGELAFRVKTHGIKYLLPKMINLPTDINPRHLNTYLKAGMRTSSELNETPKIPVSIFLIGFIIGACVYLFNKSWPWALGIGYLSYIILGAMFTSVQKTKVGELYKTCPQCKNPIIITIERPSSAWECSHCGYNHFEYWRTHSALAKNLRT